MHQNNELENDQTAEEGRMWSNLWIILVILKILIKHAENIKNSKLIN